jgi:hypothetical protein
MQIVFYNKMSWFVSELPEKLFKVVQTQITAVHFTNNNLDFKISIYAENKPLEEFIPYQLFYL